MASESGKSFSIAITVSNRLSGWKAGQQQSKADYSLFTKQQGSSFTALLIYVDVILLTGNDLQEMNHHKTHMLKCFRIKDLKDLRYFLDIEFSRSKEGV